MGEINILFISDDAASLEIFEKSLQFETLAKCLVANSSDALSLLSSSPVHILLADMEMVEMENLALLKSIRENQPDIITAVVLNEDQIPKISSHMNTGEIFRFVKKPVRPEDLKAVVDASMEMFHMRQEKAGLVKSLERQNNALREALEYQKEIEHKFQLLCVTDELTELFNQRQLMNALQKEIAASKRYETEFSCLMVDIDYFHIVNGTYGFEFGNVVLKKLGEMLSEAIRSVDIAFRYGGEEFFVLLPHTELQEAGIVGERILEVCRLTSFKHGDISHNITVSIGGVSFTSCSPDSPEELILAAEKMLTKAKNNGRNRIEIGA